MVDEELLKLYAADQAERKKLSLLRSESEQFNMRKIIEANDAIRRELVAELIPQLNSQRPRNVRDYFYAATIYSRGTTIADIKKTYDYAKKAYNLIQFNDDDFALQVKLLYHDASRKLKGDNHNSQTQHQQDNQCKIQPPTPQMLLKKQLEEEEKEREKLKKTPTCSKCGKQHFGLCPPRP